MRLAAGQLDTLITIESRQRTQDPVFKTWSYAWGEFAQEWAEVRDVLPSRAERVAEGINIQRRPTRIRMRWRDDITGEMRVTIGDRRLQIIAGPAELGRRDGLEMVCEEMTTEGEAP